LNTCRLELTHSLRHEICINPTVPAQLQGQIKGSGSPSFSKICSFSRQIRQTSSYFFELSSDSSFKIVNLLTKQIYSELFKI